MVRKFLDQKEEGYKLDAPDFSFHSLKFAFVPARCPVCSKKNARILLSLLRNPIGLVLLTCKKCRSIYYPNAKAPDYEVVEDESSFYMRIDQAEGIDSSIMPVFSVPSLKDFAVIDIGCGLGFASDFVRYQGRECLAFDPSSAAKISSEILNIAISQEYASVSNTKTKNKNRLIFASEVIEHVENPLEFLKELKAIAGEHGYLIVTTPNADYVKKGNPSNTIMAMLAPGQHLFLLSAKALEDLAREAGFTWAASWTQNERLFLVAGPEVKDVANQFSRANYIEYLKARLIHGESDEKVRYRSFGYRLFKEYVHAGRYEEATELWESFTIRFKSMGFDLQAPSKIVSMYEQAACGGTVIPKPKNFPFNMSMIMFLRGVLLIAYDHDRLAAKPYFEAASNLSRIYRRAYAYNGSQSYDVELQNVEKWVRDQEVLHSL